MSEETAPHVLRRMAEIAESFGSPLYRTILEVAGNDVEGGGPTREVLRDELQATVESAMPLRLTAALHRLVLEGRAPRLAEFYASAGGRRPAEDGLRDVLLEVMSVEVETLRELVARPCQTNEVGRCAGLILGFLTVARKTGLPLRLLEIGASAGLNLRWDQFRYEHGDAAWGPPDSPVRLTGRWNREPEVFATGDVQVVERRGCDPNPMDPADPETILALKGSIWADQEERFRLLEGALRIASRIPATVERSNAGDWLEGELRNASSGTATIVYHSVVWQYLDPPEREQVRDTIRAAGERATEDAPLAWLSTEPQEVAKRHRVRLTMWPGGDIHSLAETGPHGDPVLTTR